MKWQAFKPLFDQTWWKIMEPFVESKACDKIYDFLKTRSKVATIVPHHKDTWRAFALCKLSNLKVVLVGQDPYTTPGVADGLAFSVKTESETWPPTQPSLEALFTAIEEDCYNGLNLRMSTWPDLHEWAVDGVLLLNYSLTAESSGEPGAHKDLWLPFHEYLIKSLNKETSNIVYILLGSKAHDLRRFVDEENSLVLEAEHPSYANRIGRKMDHRNVFSKANQYLKKRRNEEVDWARTLPF